MDDKWNFYITTYQKAGENLKKSALINWLFMIMTDT